jgi:hypothetical protein
MSARHPPGRLLERRIVKAYPAETTEAFLGGHVSAFEFFGSAPLSILYDNLKIARARICGDGKRERTRAFIELVSHYRVKVPRRQGRQGRPLARGLCGYYATAWLLCNKNRINNESCQTACNDPDLGVSSYQVYSMASCGIGCKDAL